MNIFEKYGSYEFVRQAAENYKNSGDRVTAAGLELQCLEYRRQHNIFEVGDKVVVLTNALGNKYTWMVESIDGIMVEISQVGHPNEWVHYSEIAHTTPEEIKAGKRL